MVDDGHLARQITAHLTSVGVPGHLEIDSPKVEPRPDKANTSNQQQDVKKSEKEIKASAKGVKTHHEQQSHHADESPIHGQSQTAPSIS